MTPQRHLPTLLCALLGLLAALALPGTVRPARADDWSDMRGEFREAMKQEDWRQRRDAFIYVSDFDRPEAVAEILSALAKEKNDAVVLAGVEALSGQKSLASREALFKTARKGKGRQKLLVLVALGKQKGKEVADLLLDVASGRDAPAAAQAALALKAHKRDDAVPVLVKLLKNGAWQVRRAAAITLGAWKAKDAAVPLAFAFSAATGRDRNDLLAALEAITGLGFGNDPAAWKQFAMGKAPEEIRAKPKLAPTVFGVPIYGQRVVICLDNSLRMTDPHPFDSERLRELCDPKDGDPIPWFRMKTNAAFAHGHVKHLLKGLPKSTKIELITFNAIVRDTFAGLTSLGTTTRNTALQVLDDLQTDDGIDSFGALVGALDVGGAKESQAWKSGPDEILFITVNMPTAGDIKEADVVAAAISLKAGLRMVPIHTVGIHFHPYAMCAAIAANTGGVYVNLVK